MPNSNPLFPSASDQLSKSHKTRITHLSSDELIAIRSLVGSAIGAERTSPPLSTHNAAKKQTITGRRVLVPVTSKGLFEGILDPPSYMGREQLIIHIGEGKFEQMSREDADVFFHMQFKELSPSRKVKPGKSAVTPKALSSSIKKQSNDGKGNEIMAGRADLNEKVTNAKPIRDKNIDESKPSNIDLPFIEIREEVDSSGKIAHSEIINISNQISRLNKLKDFKERNREDEKGFGKLLADALKDGENDIRTIDIDDNLSDVSAQTQLPSHQTKQIISETDYKALYSRLEELERLEEEEDATLKADNVKKSNGLQSKGWSRGFLNSKPKSLSTDRKSNRVTTNSKPVNTKNESAKAPMKQVAKVPTSYNADDESKTDRKVTFSPDVDVTEVPPRAASMLYNSSNLDDVKAVDPFPPIEAVPFEENIFKGVVKERTAPNPIMEHKKNNPILDNEGQGNQKKLSRFAMQRLQRG